MRAGCSLVSSHQNVIFHEHDELLYLLSFIKVHQLLVIPYLRYVFTFLTIVLVDSYNYVFIVVFVLIRWTLLEFFFSFVWTDVNECLAWDNQCSDGCLDLPGTYKCTCPDGKYLNPLERYSCECTWILALSIFQQFFVFYELFCIKVPLTYIWSQNWTSNILQCQYNIQVANCYCLMTSVACFIPIVVVNLKE